MKSKKNQAKNVTIQTWFIFGMFLVVSFICLKVVFSAKQINDSIVIPTPVVVQIPAKATTTIHKAVKK